MTHRVATGRGTRAVVLATAVALISLALFGNWYRSATTPSEDRTAETLYLPFNLPTAPTPRKVFAHYVPHFAVSIDNADSATDYYQTQYLTPGGEDGTHAAYGGFLRDRPLPRPPIAGADWKMTDALAEIKQAKSVGIDGFAFDVIDPHPHSEVVSRFLTAAAGDPSFRILVTPDMSGPLAKLSVADFASQTADYLASPGAFRLSDGRPVLGAFSAESHGVEWWTAALAAISTKLNQQVAFVPTFVDVSDNIDQYSAISYGLSVWGTRNPDGMATEYRGHNSPVDLVQRTHQMGRIWMQSVPFQDNRPRSGKFEEALNGQTNRMAWQLAIEQHAEWVQLITWNDYAETTAMAPSVAHGWGILDMNAYDIVRFKWNKTPKIVRDTLIASYRIQPWATRPRYPETSLMAPAPSTTAPRDAIEVVSFATARSRVEVSTGRTTTTCDVPAGRGTCLAPLVPGTFVSRMIRDGKVIATVNSSTPITDTPFVQDLQYYVVGSRR